MFIRMKFLKAFLIITFSFSLLLSAMAVDNNKDAGDFWLAAYSLYEKAEQYYDTEDYSSSFVYYQKALKKFNDLHDAYPDWNPELVSYRITHCEEKETIIKNKLAQGNMDKSSDDLIRENIELQTRLVDYQDKLANEQDRLKDALSRTEKNQEEFLKNNEATETIKRVMKEKIELEKKYSLVSDGLGEDAVESSNLIENLRNDMEQQRKKLENILQEKQKIENEHNEFKKKYNNMVLQKADIDYRLKVEDEKSRDRESKSLQASRQIESLSDEIKRLTIEKNTLAKKLSAINNNFQEEQQKSDSLKTNIKTSDDVIVSQLSQENSSLKKQVEDFQKEIDRLNNIKESYSYELNKSKEVQAEAVKTISFLQSKYSVVSEEIEKLRKLLKESETRESEYSKKTTEMAAKLAENKEKYNLLTTRYKYLESKQKNLVIVESKNLDLEREKKQLSEQIHNYQLQAEENKRQIASIQEAKEKLEKEQVSLIQDNLSSSLESENKYNQKIKDLNEASRKLKELEVANTEKEQKLNELLNKMKYSEENYASLHRNNNKIHQELVNAEIIINQLKKTNSAQLKDVSNLSDQLRVSNIKNQEYERIKNQLENAINDSNSKLASLKKERDEHLDRYNDLMKRYKNQIKLAEQMNKEGFSERIKVLADKLEKAEKKEQHSNFLISLSEEKNISLNAKINELEKVRREQSTLIDLLTKQLEAVNKKKDGADLTALNCRLVEVLRNLKDSEQQLLVQSSTLAKYQDDYKNLQKELGELQDSRNALEKKYAEASTKIKFQERINKDQEKQISNLLGEIDTLSISLNKSKQDRDNLTQQLAEHSAQFSKSKRDYELQITKLNSIIKEGRENGDKVFQLATDNLGLINNLKEAEKKIKTLEQQKEEQLKQIEASSLSFDQKMANDCEKEALNKNVSLKLAFVISRLNDLEKERVATSARVSELLNEISERDKLLQSQKDANDKANLALTQAKKSVLKSEKRVISVQKKYEKLLNKNMDIEKNFQNLNKQLVSTRNDLKEVEIRAKNLESINKNFQGSLLNEKNKTAVLQKETTEKAGIIKGLTQKIDEFKQQISDGAASQALLKNKLENSLSIVESLKRDKSELLFRMESIIFEEKRMADEISCLKTQLSGIESENLKLISDKTEISTQLEEANKKILILQTKQSIQRKRIEEQFSKIEAASVYSKNYL